MYRENGRVYFGDLSHIYEAEARDTPECRGPKRRGNKLVEACTWVSNGQETMRGEWAEGGRMQGWKAS